MKTIILLVAFSAAANPTLTENKVSLLENDHVVMTMDELEKEQFFLSADYPDSEGQMNFVTKADIHTILIYSGDEVVFVLPVMTDRVSMGASLFDEVKATPFQLGFNFKDNRSIVIADVMLK